MANGRALEVGVTSLASASWSAGASYSRTVAMSLAKVAARFDLDLSVLGGGTRAGRLLAACAIVACARAPNAAHVDTPHEHAILVHLGDHPPTLDGVADQDEWRDATMIDGFSDLQGMRERRRALAYVSADEHNLYLAILSKLPETGGLQSGVDQSTLELVHDDSIEVWIDPEPERPRHAVYRMIANSRGTTAFHASGYGTRVAPDWEQHWRVASGMHDGLWQVEVRIPIAAIAGGRRPSEGAWRINLCRNWKRPWKFSSMFGGDYAHGRTFRFDRGVPAVHQLHRRDPLSGWVDSLLDVYNPSANAIEIDVVQSLRPDVTPNITERRRVKVAPGATERIALEKLEQHSERFELEQNVKLGNRVLFTRKSEWERGAQDFQWRIDPNVEPLLGLEFAYYPSLDELRVTLDASRVRGSTSKRAVRVELRRDGGELVLAQDLPLAASQRAELRKHLPGLRGRYRLVAQLRDAEGRIQRAERSFERKAIPGENSQLGTSRRVFPPFEPLRYDDGVLRATLREHRIGRGLLWQQVNAEAAETGVREDLFAAPMRVIARIGDREQKVEASSIEVERSDPDRVVLESELKAGPLSIEVRATTDVDGMTWFEWTLRPMDAILAELTLELPLRADQTPLIHAMSDGIRNSIVHQALPAGEGRVWSSTTLEQYRVPANWASYVYLGSGVRGLAWFAENDRGWRWDEATPNIEVVRRRGEVVLRVHLVNVRGALTAKRTLKFGLQAAPLKRRIANWRYLWSRDRYVLLGTDLNWLGGSNCGSLYPVELEMWEALAKANRTGMDADEIAAVVQRGKPWFESHEGAASLFDWKQHVEHNLGPARKGVKTVYYYNRASSPAYDEFQTYQDEWTLGDYRNPQLVRKLAWEIKVVPSRSYNDIALYWYDQSFARGANRGVYWDNWFIMGSSNTRMTDAYVRPGGRVRPAAGMLGMRELSRRTFQWLSERQAAPVITMPHMTSTNILPMMGFATFQLDWESHYGEGPMQRRFPPEYLQLMSTGELSGTVPVTIFGAGNTDLAYVRSDAAVRLVHELDALSVGRGVPRIDDALHTIVRAPNLRVYRYWDERAQPARSSDPNVRAIAYVLPGQRTLVGLASWHDHAVEATVELDWKTLGLDPQRVRVRNVEADEPVALRDGRLDVRLPEFDLALFELSAR
jgi:Family of unknown function (DUF6067)